MFPLSVFTPVYNRAYILHRLYESLKQQTEQRFEWIIVNDGSTDNLDELVECFRRESSLNIIYISQSNQGKHIAINTGVAAARGELFFIVDSDDQLTSDAVEKICSFWQTNARARSDISGIISYRQFPDGKLVGNKLPEHVRQCKLRECRTLYGSVGDKVVIYRTSILKQYPYPKIEGERFLGESYVFNQIDDAYDMLIMDDAFYLFDYQPDGLSQKFRKLYRHNPRGFLLLYKQDFHVTGYSYCAKLRILSHILCLALRCGEYCPCVRKYVSLRMLPAIAISLALYTKIFILKANDVKAYYGSESTSNPSKS